MSLSVQQMRINLKTVYSSASWHLKVLEMPESQVIAIHAKFVRENKIKI